MFDGDIFSLTSSQVTVNVTAQVTAKVTAKATVRATLTQSQTETQTHVYARIESKNAQTKKLFWAPSKPINKQHLNWITSNRQMFVCIRLRVSLLHVEAFVYIHNNRARKETNAQKQRPRPRLECSNACKSLERCLERN